MRSSSSTSSTRAKSPSRTSSRSRASWVRRSHPPDRLLDLSTHACGCRCLCDGVCVGSARTARMRALTLAHCRVGENMTDEEIMEMITAADIDKDGMINEEEFWRVMKR